MMKVIQRGSTVRREGDQGRAPRSCSVDGTEECVLKGC